ncbi:MAG: tRNA 2-thiouridine(34) synthase MnmA, partial [Clostridia bacterium]|nr:tRNA 2-thiouridine(34) synthase MnmA [Clostridia bacterium]
MERLDSPIDCLGKLRYRHNEQPCRITPLSDDILLAEFNEPQRAPTYGQAAVFYDGDTVICGGVISKE